MKRISIKFFMVCLIVLLSACSRGSDVSDFFEKNLSSETVEKGTKTFVIAKDDQVHEWGLTYEGEEVKKAEFIRKEIVMGEKFEEELKEFGLSGLFTTDPIKFLKAASTIKAKSEMKKILTQVQEYYDKLALIEESEVRIKGVDVNIKYSIKDDEKISRYKINLSKVDYQYLDEVGFSFLYEMGIKEMEQMFLEEGFVSKEDFVLNNKSNKTSTETENAMETDSLLQESQETNEEIEETVEQNGSPKAKNQEMKVLVGEYIFPSSDSDYLTYEEIEYVVSVGGSDLLRLAINEMYARHGFVFSKEKNQTYFSKKSWYYPVEGLTDEYVKTQLFNEYETENLKKLLEIEEQYKK